MDALVEALGSQKVVCGIRVGCSELSFSGSLPKLHQNPLE